MLFRSAFNSLISSSRSLSRSCSSVSSLLSCAHSYTDTQAYKQQNCHRPHTTTHSHTQHSSLCTLTATAYYSLAVVSMWPHITRCSAVAKRPCDCCLGQFWPKYNRKTIFYGYYMSIFNHCDVIGMLNC